MDMRSLFLFSANSLGGTVAIIIAHR